jgi:hypothetical protein
MSFARTSTIAIALLVCGLDAAAAPIPIGDYLPFVESGWTAGIGGTGNCFSQPSYDVETFAYLQTGDCFGDRTAYNLLVDGTYQRSNPFTSWQATLAGLVDNDGQLIGGSFAAFGSLPQLGIEDESLLLTGTLIDVFFGPGISCCGGTSGRSFFTLIHLNFVAEPFVGLGSLLMWNSNVWPYGFGSGCNAEPSHLPCTPWKVSMSTAGFNNFTGSQWMFFDESILQVAEPGTLLLLSAGLLALGVSRRRREVRAI